MHTVWSLTKSITYPNSTSDLQFTNRMLEDDMFWTFASNSDVQRVKTILGLPGDCTMRPIYYPTDAGETVKAFCVSAYRNHHVYLIPALFPSKEWIRVREGGMAVDS